ncbi:MAG: tetratricopeptide repeat protein [candidate division NC10 bacterium]|nr:tetratricopeptide repeat protein [candidate division NC10 bacterium]
MQDETRRRRAIELWQQAYHHQMRQEYDQAIRLYQESMSLCPTAEAHTFLGWTYSFQDRLDEAIAECHKAIAIDPDFGNPYNDIGVYLMQKGDLDGAIPWFERAKTAARYEPRHYPYINLGRIYLRRNAWQEAQQELAGAVRIAPDDQTARKLLHEVWARLN